MNLTWFYFQCVLALVILVKDYNGTLEESFNNFEKRIGLYMEPDTTIDSTPPFYVPPTEQDSTWILPPIERDTINIENNYTNINEENKIWSVRYNFYSTCSIKVHSYIYFNVMDLE